MSADFLLACSAVIPLLGLAILIELRAFDVPLEARPIPRRLKLGALFSVLYLAGFAGYAEWVCLRSLELGHLTGGGTFIIWAALAVLAGTLIAALALRIVI